MPASQKTTDMATKWTSTANNTLSDAELVKRAIAGDIDAFDCLVIRHRKGVLRAARSDLRNWEQAEDVAQQALVEAYRGLPGIRDIAKFRSWLMTITKRCALRYRGRLTHEPEALEFNEAVIYPLITRGPFSADHNVRERIRASLAELSFRSRQVVTLHYLDGYSCREIGSRLGVSEGTVKRILHESRNNLRAGMGITSARAKGDVREMEVISEPKKGPRELVWWINGTWPGGYMNSLLAQSIALTINKAPMTADQIADCVDANARFVNEALRPLVDEELVKKTSDDKYLTNFIALSAGDWIEFSHGIRMQGAKLADAIVPHLPALEKAWNRTSFPAKGLAWPEMIWTVMSVLVCNIGISRNGVPELPAPVHPASGKTYWAGGREAVPDKYVVWGTGFNNSGPTYNGSDFRQGNFWTYALDRDTTGWNEERSEVIAAIAQGASDIENIAGKTGQPVDKVREIVAKMIEHGLAERKDDRLLLRFPVFTQEEDEVLCPVVDAVSTELAETFLGPMTADAAGKMRELGYGHLEEQFPAWRRWMEGDIAGESLRELLKRGILPDPGEPAPVEFAMVGWIGSLRLFAWSK